MWAAEGIRRLHRAGEHERRAMRVWARISRLRNIVFRHVENGDSAVERLPTIFDIKTGTLRSRNEVNDINSNKEEIRFTCQLQRIYINRKDIINTISIQRFGIFSDPSRIK